MPLSIVRAFGILKKCAAKTNLKYGLPTKIGIYNIINSLSNSRSSRLSDTRKIG
jgi:fumarate hydratase class II